MGVIKPGYNLQAKADLRELRFRLKGGGRHRRIHQELTLTSMVDMFAVIIIFLIQSFSTSGELFVVNKKVVLPNASHGQVVERSPIITVLEDKVTLEGYQVGDNANIKDIIEESNWELPMISSALDGYKQWFESTQQDVKKTPRVIVQADKDLDFLYLKRVLYTLTKHGYGNIDLLVKGQARNSHDISGQDMLDLLKDAIQN